MRYTANGDMKQECPSDHLTQGIREGNTVFVHLTVNNFRLGYFTYHYKAVTNFFLQSRRMPIQIIF